jgi:crotonobetainyl-CoA:carnitine CoA-transferase CaiB-like acyl-CoA transferase
MEAATALIGEFIVGYGLTGEVPSSLGNRHPYMAPHGCYPCQGEDRWLVISVGSDEEWCALCTVIGRPELAADERFADQLNRWHHQDDLDEIISAWTRNIDHRVAMRILQDAGVAAGAVLDAEEMAHDEHLAERGFFWEIPHPAAGTFSYPGLPIHFSSLALGARLPAPLLGEHNEHVFIDLLGLSTEDLADLEHEGAIDLVSA